MKFYSRALANISNLSGVLMSAKHGCFLFLAMRFLSNCTGQGKVWIRRLSVQTIVGGVWCISNGIFQCRGGMGMDARYCCDAGMTKLALNVCTCFPQ